MGARSPLLPLFPRFRRYWAGNCQSKQGRRNRGGGGGGAAPARLPPTMTKFNIKPMDVTWKESSWKPALPPPLSEAISPYQERSFSPCVAWWGTWEPRGEGWQGGRQPPSLKKKHYRSIEFARKESTWKPALLLPIWFVPICSSLSEAMGLGTIFLDDYSIGNLLTSKMFWYWENCCFMLYFLLLKALGSDVKKENFWYAKRRLTSLEKRPFMEGVLCCRHDNL